MYEGVKHYDSVCQLYRGYAMCVWANGRARASIIKRWSELFMHFFGCRWNICRIIFQLLSAGAAAVAAAAAGLHMMTELLCRVFTHTHFSFFGFSVIFHVFSALCHSLHTFQNNFTRIFHLTCFFLLSTHQLPSDLQACDVGKTSAEASKGNITISST